MTVTTTAQTPDHLITLAEMGQEDQVEEAMRRLHPADAAELLAARIPGARRVTIPATGHSPSLENSDAFNETLTAFLARH